MRDAMNSDDKMFVARGSDHTRKVPGGRRSLSGTLIESLYREPPSCSWQESGVIAYFLAPESLLAAVMSDFST